MQAHMLGQAAVVGVEVLVVPLVGTVVGVLLLVVVPVVVGEHFEAVVATVVDVGGPNMYAVVNRT